MTILLTYIKQLFHVKNESKTSKNKHVYLAGAKIRKKKTKNQKLGREGGVALQEHNTGK